MKKLRIYLLLSALLVGLFIALVSTRDTQSDNISKSIETISFRVLKEGYIRPEGFSSRTISVPFDPNQHEVVSPKADFSMSVEPIFGEGKLSGRSLGYEVSAPSTGSAKIWTDIDDSDEPYQWTLNAKNHLQGDIKVVLIIETGEKTQRQRQWIIQSGQERLPLMTGKRLKSEKIDAKPAVQ